MKTDIEIAQSCTMRPITDIAATAGVDGQISGALRQLQGQGGLSLLRENALPDGKLILVTAINPLPPERARPPPR